MSDISELTGTDTSAKTGIAVFVFATYLFVAQILLVNLLIAMMNASYNELQARTTEQWASSRAAIIEELQLNFAVPPPFSAPFIALDLLGRLAAGARSCAPEQRGMARDSALAKGVAEGRRRAHAGQLRHMRAYIDAERKAALASTDSRLLAQLKKADQIASMLEAADAERARALEKSDRMTEMLLAAETERKRLRELLEAHTLAARGADEVRDGLAAVRAHLEAISLRMPPPPAGSERERAGRAATPPAPAPPRARLAARAQAGPRAERAPCAAHECAQRAAPEPAAAARPAAAEHDASPTPSASERSERRAVVRSPHSAAAAEQPGRPARPPAPPILASASGATAAGSETPLRGRSRATQPTKASGARRAQQPGCVPVHVAGATAAGNPGEPRSRSQSPRACWRK